MIKISGSTVGRGALDDAWLTNPVTRKIINTMRRSRDVYAFDSERQLSFALEMRQNIVEAARGLYQSGMGFSSFYNSRCNEQYWSRTSNGGFQLKSGVTPAAAINDIYQNGSLYATECATAMVILLYRAVLVSIGETAFNRYFSNLLLWDWELDEDLGLDWSVPADYFPGDVRYFKNPDVNPLHMELQGENAIDMGNGLYYGHGIGIVSATEIIRVLNANRKPGADQSAYLMDEAGRPAYNHLAGLAGTRMASQTASNEVKKHFITVTLGEDVQVY